MRKSGCPGWETCPQWCRRVVPGWQGQASCLEKHHERHLYVEVDWDPDSLTEFYPRKYRFLLELVIKAIKLMKCGKAAGTSVIVAEMLKASGVEGAQQIRDLITDTIPFWEFPYPNSKVHGARCAPCWPHEPCYMGIEWEQRVSSSPSTKARALLLREGNFRCFKLLDQVMKIL